MTSLDDTYGTMSSSNFDSAAVLGQGLISSVKRSLGQQFSKPIILDLPLGSPSRSVDSFNSGVPNAPRSAEQTSGGQSAPQPSGQQAAPGGDGGGGHAPGRSGGQPPDGSGSHSSGSTLSTEEKTSGESTATTAASGSTLSGSSMPELVDPPPDPSSMSLLYPVVDTSSQEESSKRIVGEEADAIAAQRSDDSQVSEATTAVASDTDAHGLSLSRHYGLHVVSVGHTSGASPRSAVASTSSSSPVKAHEALDTTASTLSPFTNTSADKSKSSDSSGHLDVSRETVDLFDSEKEFAVSTPTPAAAVAGRTADLELSEFLIPPSGKCEDSLSLDDQSSSYASNVWEQAALGGQVDTPVRSHSCIKRPYAVETSSKEPEVPQKRKQPELHLELPSTSDLHLIQPSRRAAVDMAVKATRGEFLMKSMSKADEGQEGVGAVSEKFPSKDDGPTATSDPPAEVEPSSKVMRQIVFDSLTSSDEASAPSSLATKGTLSGQSLMSTGGAEDASRLQQKPAPLLTSMLPPESAAETEEGSPETDRLRLLIASQEAPTTIAGPDRTVVEDIVEDTEEDEDLILRYCPSQTSQSQYYPLVPETDVTDQDSQDDGQPQQADTSRAASTEGDSHKPDALEGVHDDDDAPPPTHLPTFDLRRPSPVASDDDENPDIDDESSSEEKNPFETVNFFAEPRGKPMDAPQEETAEGSSGKSKKRDEPDVPGGPVGRHKRKNVWGEEGDLADFTRAYVAKKHPKLAARSFGCQVQLDDCGEASVKDDEEDEAKAESKAVQTVLSGEIKPVEESQQSDVDGAEKSGRRREFLRRTVVVRRTITEELFRRGKMVVKKIFEEEDDPVVTEYTGREVRESVVFARPTPPDKQSPSGSSSSKSTSANVSLNKSASSSSLTSGVLGDVSSSMSKSSPSPKQTSSDEQPVTSPAPRKASGEMRTLRSVRRRKVGDIRKNLALSESDSTPETKVIESPIRKQGRPRSKDPVGSKRRGDGDEATTSTAKTVAEQPAAQPAAADAQTISGETEPVASSSRKRKSQPSSARVMARWRDGCYYPGLILDREKDDRVRVEYDDGTIRSIKARDVLAVAVLPVGQCVLSMSADGLYDSSLIVDHYEDSESGDVGYVVEIDGGGAARRVTRSRIILTADQAATLETNAGTPPVTRPGTANISLDNLVEGKRRSGPPALSTPPVPRTRRAARRLDEASKKKKASKAAAEESPSSDS